MEKRSKMTSFSFDDFLNPKEAGKIVSMSRFTSIIHSIERNGVKKTIDVLAQMVLFRFGLRTTISIGRQTFFLRRHTSDLPVLRQVYLDGEYDFDPGIEPSVIVDLGANVGISALFFAEKFPRASIIAIEPDLQNYQQLLKNIASYPTIQAFNYAIWSRSENLSMVTDKSLGEWGTRVGDKAGSEVSGVKGITMAELMQTLKIDSIDILKIDIEGAEEEIFKEAGWMNKVEIITIELHDRLLPGSSNNFFRSLNQFKQFNFFIQGENVVVRKLS